MRIISFVFLFIFTHLLAGQEFTDDDYYLFPINPGQQNYLAGSMGEIRPNHFHAGIDVKTGGRIGLPIYAAADGYISRIKISANGYGNALYLTHPNGTITVYAHLDRFIPLLKEYTIDQQYRQESFEVDLFPEKGKFSFKQGEIIAFSGNTGSSLGPHLHFEIRDINHQILDPLKFNFKEIQDNIKPLMKNIAFVTLDENARVNGSFGRYEYSVLRSYGTYKPHASISLKGNIGIEIYAYDLMNGVYSRTGISKITLFIDGDTIFSQRKSKLSFAKQRSINVHIDYQGYRKTGKEYNKLFVDDGNDLDIYPSKSKGFHFSDSTHLLKILLEDSYGNTSVFETVINNSKNYYTPSPRINKYEVFRNYLHLKADYNIVPNNLSVFVGGGLNEISPYRSDSRSAYYIWDLRTGLPDSIDFCGDVVKTGFYAEIPSTSEVSFYNHDVDLYFRENTLFDTLYLQFQKSYDSAKQLELFNFMHQDDPLNKSVKTTLKPKHNYDPDKYDVYSYYSGSLNFVGGKWNDNTISFYTRNLGSYTIASDTLAPRIIPRIVNNRDLYFRIKDDLSGIKSFRATLNGEFLLMKYERKRNLIWAVPKNENIPFKGEFILDVTDNADNVKTYKTNL